MIYYISFCDKYEKSFIVLSMNVGERDIMRVLQWFYISATWGREVGKERYSFSPSFDRKFICELDNYRSPRFVQLYCEGRKQRKWGCHGYSICAGHWALFFTCLNSCNPHDNLGSRYNYPNYMDVQIEVKRLNNVSAWSVTQPRFDPLIFWHIKPYSFTNAIAWDLLN